MIAYDMLRPRVVGICKHIASSSVCQQEGMSSESGTAVTTRWYVLSAPHVYGELLCYESVGREDADAVNGRVVVPSIDILITHHEPNCKRKVARGYF